MSSSGSSTNPPDQSCKIAQQLTQLPILVTSMITGHRPVTTAMLNSSSATSNSMQRSPFESKDRKAKVRLDHYFTFDTTPLTESQSTIWLGPQSRPKV